MIFIFLGGGGGCHCDLEICCEASGKIEKQLRELCVVGNETTPEQTKAFGRQFPRTGRRREP